MKTTPETQDTPGITTMKLLPTTDNKAPRDPASSGQQQIPPASDAYSCPPYNNKNSGGGSDSIAGPPGSSGEEEPNRRRFFRWNFGSEESLLLVDSSSHHNSITQIPEQAEECVHNDHHNDEDEKELIVYLIRHGEAEHNVLEKIAMKKALEESVSGGLAKDDPRTEERVEKARKNVLDDERLRDAKLSDLGRKEAEGARDALRTMIAGGLPKRPSAVANNNNNKNSSSDADSDCSDDYHHHVRLEHPRYVLVSPLTRTLETANIIFPGHDEIHVRDDLAERRTGKPPDTRSSVRTLCTRRAFRRFSMNILRQVSVERRQNNNDGGDEDSDRRAPRHREQQRQQEQQHHEEVVIMNDDLCNRFEDHGGPNENPGSEEDKEELRKRTERLFVLLGETDHNSVAVVTHKGYLRELERGPLGQTDAKLFQNCEIRAYRVTVSMAGHRLVAAERVW